MLKLSKEDRDILEQLPEGMCPDLLIPFKPCNTRRIGERIKKLERPKDIKSVPPAYRDIFD